MNEGSVFAASEPPPVAKRSLRAIVSSLMSIAAAGAAQRARIETSANCLHALILPVPSRRTARRSGGLEKRAKSTRGNIKLSCSEESPATIALLQEQKWLAF